MKSIKLNKKVSEYLLKKLSVNEINDMLDTAVNFAFQNATLQAKRTGQSDDEAVVLASLKISDMIDEKFGKQNFYGSYFGGEVYEIKKTEYCEIGY